MVVPLACIPYLPRCRLCVKPISTTLVLPPVWSVPRQNKNYRRNRLFPAYNCRSTFCGYCALTSQAATLTNTLGSNPEPGLYPPSTTALANFTCCLRCSVRTLRSLSHEICQTRGRISLAKVLQNCVVTKFEVSPTFACTDGL